MPPNEDNSHYEKILATGEVKCIDDEIPFEIPKSWEWVRMNELGIYRKGPFGSSLTKSMFVPQSVNAIKVYEQKNAIQKDYKLGEYFISQEKFKSMRSFIVQPNDIIVSCAGTIGETYLLPKEAPIGIINQALMRVCLYHLPMADFWQMYFDYILVKESKMKGAGSAIKNIPPFEYLKAILVPIPPKEEQKRIVACYSRILQYIEKYEDLKNKKEELNNNIYPLLRKAILQEAIQGKLVEQCATDEPAAKLLERIREEKKQLVKQGKLKAKDIVDSVIFKGDDNKYYEQIGGKCLDITQEIPFDIPNSWVWIRIKCIYQTSSGGTPEKGHPEYYGGTIPWVKVGDLSNIYISQAEDSISDLGLANSSAKLFPKETILVAMYCNDAIGKSSILLSPMTTNQAICGLYPNPFLNTEYIYYAIQNNRKNLQEQSAGGAQKNINQKIINNMLIPIPPIEEQMRIVEKIQRLYKKL